jgi:riboflavin kinase/FMN adenylyltransferase
MLDNKTVIALGYFDSVHIGHRQVIKKARETAEKLSANLAVFTFGGNLKGAIFGEDEKCVYTPVERKAIMSEIGVSEVFFAPTTKEFLSLDKKEFLDFINQKYNIVCYVSGLDYRFGKNGLGDKDFLKEYATSHSQDYLICDTENYKKEKISTTRIKECLAKGKVKEAGEMLGRSYSITGKVFEDRKVGRKLGFPTVNVKIDREKFKLLCAVYKGRVNLGGIDYDAVINYGARPTFDLDNALIEAHIVDYNGDLYGREITIYFENFMRKIKKFSSIDELQEQLREDVREVKEGKYD